MEALNNIIQVGKDLVGKVSPFIDKISEPIAGFIGVSPDNVHMMIVLALSLWVAHIIDNNSRGLGIKFWIVGIGGFLLLKYLGL